MKEARRTQPKRCKEIVGILKLFTDRNFSTFSGAYSAITAILPIAPHVALPVAAGMAVVQWLLHVYRKALV